MGALLYGVGVGCGEVVEGGGVGAVQMEAVARIIDDLVRRWKAVMDVGCRFPSLGRPLGRP